MFSEKHWLEMFSLLGMTNKPPEALTLGDFLAVKDQIIVSDQKLQVNFIKINHFFKINFFAAFNFRN